jgi:hypothetical protein
MTYCAKCGFQNDPAAQYCASCGAMLSGSGSGSGSGPGPGPGPAVQATYSTSGGPVSSHIVPAILITLFCCQPLGIVAIVFSAMAMSKNSSGDYNGAAVDARRAKQLCWWGFGLGLLGIVVGVIIWVIMMVLAAASAGA